MVKGLIFDLDNCLSAADEPGAELLAPVFEAIRRTNHGRFSEAELEAIAHDAWRHPLDAVAHKHGFPREMLSAAWAAYEPLEVSTPMHGYEDLNHLAELHAEKFLVTSGFRRMQESKIRALGIAPLFSGVMVDAIDEPSRIGKEGFFRKILQDHKFSPDEVLVVGDNPESEIAAGNRMGIPTVQILRPGVKRGTQATHYICELSELSTLISGGSPQRPVARRRPMVIVLLGVSGSGKTTIGILLAKSVGCAFYDGDDFHSAENKAKMHHGIPLTDEDRWPWLERLKKLIGRLLETHRTAALACSALQKEYRQLLWQEGVRFVYLKGDYALFKKRLEGRKGHFFDPELLQSQFEDLEEPQKALTIDAAQTPEQIVEEIQERLGLG